MGLLRSNLLNFKRGSGQLLLLSDFDFDFDFDFDLIFFGLSLFPPPGSAVKRKSVGKEEIGNLQTTKQGRKERASGERERGKVKLTTLLRSNASLE